MGLKKWKKRIEHEEIRKALGLSKSTIDSYFCGRLKGTATQRKIVAYLKRVYDEELKGILKKS